MEGKKVVTTDAMTKTMREEINKTYNQRRAEQNQEWGNKYTDVDYMVFDNFYENPMHMRSWALQQDFTQTGNYPGLRTTPFPYENWGKHIEQLMNIKINKEKWYNSMYNGAFQSVTRNIGTWVHADTYNTYSCIIFLNPYAPPNTGTSFYEHRETGSRLCNDDSKWLNDISTEHGRKNMYASRDDTWRKVDSVSNKFNRAVIFKGNLWHAADDYFGWDLETSRLTQTFFFDGDGDSEF